MDQCPVCDRHNEQNRELKDSAMLDFFGGVTHEIYNYQCKHCRACINQYKMGDILVDSWAAETEHTLARVDEFFPDVQRFNPSHEDFDIIVGCVPDVKDKAAVYESVCEMYLNRATSERSILIIDDPEFAKVMKNRTRLRPTACIQVPRHSSTASWCPSMQLDRSIIRHFRTCPVVNYWHFWPSCVFPRESYAQALTMEALNLENDVLRELHNEILIGVRRKALTR